jgi:DNA-3-methyladenine glycosylase
MSKLPFEFYNRHVVEVAKDLLGKELHFGEYSGIITETEAYRGSDDEASHAYRGPSPRSYVMFGPAGHSYVYFIYGMYHCLNIVTEEENNPSAVLIRGIRLAGTHLNGPGKICKAFGITKEHNNIDLTTSQNFYLTSGINILEYKATPRIGIKKATDKLWRFVTLDLVI